MIGLGRNRVKNRQTPWLVATVGLSAGLVSFSVAAEPQPSSDSAILRAYRDVSDEEAIDPEESIEPTEAILARARAAWEDLDYADALTLAERAVARKDASVDERVEAYWLHGSALAVLGDSIGAGRPFRLLLRAKPDFEAPDGIPPKILAMFRLVQAEERAIAEQMRDLETKRIIEELGLESHVPSEAIGGWPLRFEYKLRDPRAVVTAMSLYYRRASDDPFSSLALAANETGLWVGELPGEWTENETGFALEYFASTRDRSDRPLAELGSSAVPHRLNVKPGTVADTIPIYTSPWFWAACAVGAVAIGVGSWVIYDRMTALPDAPGRVIF